MTRSARAALFLVIAALAGGSGSALGWGEKGHRIHGELTWRLLKKETRDKLARLLPDEKLADVANWADQVRDERPETKPWHFVNVEKGAERYDAARDCAAGECIVAKLGEFERKLADREAPQAERALALKWIVHLVGDLHQPLHVALLEDKGGNDLQVTFFDRPSNLHRVWDSELIERFDKDSRTYADELLRDVRPEDVAAWQSGTFADWADESWRLARSAAYVDPRGAPIEPGTKLGREYWLAASAVADSQLKKGAARLALVLDRALANDP